MSYGVGIIGCGLIGRKRAQALGSGRLVACFDINRENSARLAKESGGKDCGSLEEMLQVPGLDIAIIATLHNSLADFTLKAVQAGKHVLVEKPAGRRADELSGVVEAAQKSKVHVRVGFNHRYHRAFQKAKDLHNSGALGELMFIRARYGHGGRLGYEKEWRSKPEISGGGELIDQGPHLIDLSRWFLGEFTSVEGFARTYYWDMPVDDNGFMLLKTASQQVAFLHASSTEWKNTFSMEIYGRDAKLEISGLGGSYGVEKLMYYRMLPEMGPPETTIWEYPMADNSWAVEMAEFYEDIRLNREPAAGLKDAVAALKIIEKIYTESGYDHRT